MRRAAFTLVELLVCVGVIGLLLAIILPAIRSARAGAASIKCQSQLRELYAAQLAFASDHRGRFTPISQTSQRWELQLAEYVTKSGKLPRDLMHCPVSVNAVSGSVQSELISTYGLNPALQMLNWNYRRDARRDSSRIILMADKPDHATDDFVTTADGWFVLADGALGQWWRYTDHNARSTLRHGQGASLTANALMSDGHVRAMSRAEMCRDSGHWYWGSLEGMPVGQVQAGCCQ